MSTKSQTIEQQSVQTPNEAVAPQQPTKSMQEIVAIVRRDSQSDAKAYLQETEVPHGGE